MKTTFPVNQIADPLHRRIRSAELTTFSVSPMLTPYTLTCDALASLSIAVENIFHGTGQTI